MTTFSGFSEEDLRRIKSSKSNNSVFNTDDKGIYSDTRRKILRHKRGTNSNLQKLPSDDNIDVIQFDKCKLSLHSDTNDEKPNTTSTNTVEHDLENGDNQEKAHDTSNKNEIKKSHLDKPDIVGDVKEIPEDDVGSHKVKLEELQLKQKLMEEQNKIRKEMLARALADRTRQTEEEVQKLEKIKKELQILDGQFSQDVNVLRKKIDSACHSYSEAEKHYLRVEKDFLQAKIQLQKEKEKKELLTEHLCALITHNETKKAKKLEGLMLELATNRNKLNEVTPTNEGNSKQNVKENKETVIVDGVDESGKIVEIIPNS